ncbi:hypothetical protein ACFX13_007097 [Malus domestica]
MKEWNTDLFDPRTTLMEPDFSRAVTPLADADDDNFAFTEKIPETIAGLQLKSLNLNDNLLSSELPPILASNPKLRQFKIFNNSCSGSLPENLGRYSDWQKSTSRRTRFPASCRSSSVTRKSSGISS